MRRGRGEDISLDGGPYIKTSGAVSVAPERVLKHVVSSASSGTTTAVVGRLTAVHTCGGGGIVLGRRPVGLRRGRLLAAAGAGVAAAVMVLERGVRIRRRCGVRPRARDLLGALFPHLAARPPHPLPRGVAVVLAAVVRRKKFVLFGDKLQVKVEYAAPASVAFGLEDRLKSSRLWVLSLRAVKRAERRRLVLITAGRVLQYAVEPPPGLVLVGSSGPGGPARRRG